MKNIIAYVKKAEPYYRAFAIEEENLSTRKRNKLEKEGWIKVIDRDDFESVEEAYEYMEDGVYIPPKGLEVDIEKVFAYQHECKLCGWYRPCEKVIGHYWDESYTKPRKNLFNGYACEDCQSNMASIKFRGQMRTPDEINFIYKKEYMNRNR